MGLGSRLGRFSLGRFKLGDSKTASVVIDTLTNTCTDFSGTDDVSAANETFTVTATATLGPLSDSDAETLLADALDSPSFALDATSETTTDSRTDASSVADIEAVTLLNTLTNITSLVEAEAAVLRNTRTGVEILFGDFSVETLLNTLTGTESLLEDFPETLLTSALAQAFLQEILGRVDDLTASAENLQSLTDEQIVANYVADVISASQQNFPRAVGEDNQDELTVTTTSVPSLSEDANTLSASQTSSPSIVDISEVPGPDTLNVSQSNTQRITDLIDSTTNTLLTVSTNVPSITDRFINPNTLFSRPGTGGESFRVRLAPAGETHSTVLTSTVVAESSALGVDDVSVFPTRNFVVKINEEEIYITQTSSLGNLIVGTRGMGNTSVAAHSAGATVTWNDTYNMAIVSQTALSEHTNSTPDFQPGGSGTYRGFLTIFDSTQAYKPDGTRYATYIRSFVGVFPPEVGSTDLSQSKTDGPQPNSVAAADGVTNSVPASITVPARISEDIDLGDVLVCRYRNIESFVVELGPRSALGQAWYGIIRVNNSNSDVTTSDPAGFSTDGTTLAVFPNSDPLITAVMPASSRYFTNPARGYLDDGIEMGALSVRQGNRRVPLWTSLNWHNFDWVYNGFGTDCNYVQCVVRRKHVDLPSSATLQGPNATWDDPSYVTSTAWQTVLVGYESDAIILGPPVNGIPSSGGSPSDTVISYPPSSSGGGGGGIVPGVDPDEGGSGGDIAGGLSTPGVGLYLAPETLK